MSWFSVCCAIVVCLLIARGSGAVIDSTVQNSIEVRVLVDRAAINTWKDKFTSTAASDSERTVQAKAKLTEFINAVFVGLNAIYEELLQYGIRLDARIADIQFIESDKITNEYGDDQVESEDVLEEFEVYLTGKQYSLVDHTTLFTGLDLSRGTKKGVLGVAYLGWMCDRDLSISTVELQPNGDTVLTFAHELSHNIGARHDGDSNACDLDSQYVMDGSRSQNSTKNFLFSSCSVKYLRDSLQYLHDRRAGSCLAASSTSYPAPSGPHIGELYDPDTICRMNFGAQSYFGRTFYGTGGPAGIQPYSRICTAIWCLEGQGSYSSIFGTDGFVCGNGKQCRVGQCVSVAGSVASGRSDTCPFGNAPPEISPYNDGQTCSDLVSAYSGWECAESSGVWSLGRICCGSCEASVRNSGIPGCEYGDQHVDCYDYIQANPTQCSRYSDFCCYTCGGHANRTAVVNAQEAVAATQSSITTTTTRPTTVVTTTRPTTVVTTTRPTTTTTRAPTTTTRATTTTTRATTTTSRTTTPTTTTRPPTTTSRATTTTTRASAATACTDNYAGGVCQTSIVDMRYHMICYNTTHEQNCCESCSQVRPIYNGLAATCKYGNLYNGCYYDYMLCTYYQDYHNKCCGTCNRR